VPPKGPCHGKFLGDLLRLTDENDFTPLDNLEPIGELRRAADPS